MENESMENFPKQNLNLEKQLRWVSILFVNSRTKTEKYLNIGILDTKCGIVDLKENCQGQKIQRIKVSKALIAFSTAFSRNTGSMSKTDKVLENIQGAFSSSQ